jgi:L-malate glycosyltransferase
MRVLYFSDNSSDHNRRFLEKLVQADHEVWFLDLSRTGPPEGTTWSGIHWVRSAFVCPRDSAPSVCETFLPELQTILRDLQPDVVQAGPIQSCAYLIALADFHPQIAMSWGSDLLLHANQNAEWQQATEVALRGADGFFCDCDAVRRAAERYADFSDSQVVQFPWGIEPGLFSPQGPLPDDWVVTPGTIPVISTRSWEALYDPLVLFEAFAQAYRENRQLRLFALGSGSKAKEIKEFIAQNGFEAVVTTPGPIRRSELPKWFRAAKAYISCAKSDGTSVSLLEAMATGLPVVVTDIASNREWVSHGENGWLAGSGSAKDFARALLCAASLVPERRKAISERNQDIIRKRANWDLNFPALLELYDRLVRLRLSAG